MEGAKTGLRQSDSGKDPPKQKYDPFILHNGGILKKREKRRKTKKNGENSPFFKCDPFRTRVMEAPTRIELVLKILQTSALPLGYGAENRLL